MALERYTRENRSTSSFYSSCWALMAHSNGKGASMWLPGQNLRAQLAPKEIELDTRCHIFMPMRD